MLLCFDYDGVIVDSLDQHLIAVTAAHRELGCGRAPLRADFESVEDLSYEGFAKHLGIPPSECARWKQSVLAHLQNDRVVSPVFSEVPPVIKELGSRFPIVIITSNIRAIVEPSLATLGLSSCIEDIFDGLSRGTKADRIKLASERKGIPLSSTYMIGDTRGDIRHAKAAGAKAIAVGWGYQSKGVLDLEQPDMFVKIPRDLLTFFGVLEVH